MFPNPFSIPIPWTARNNLIHPFYVPPTLLEYMTGPIVGDSFGAGITYHYNILGTGSIVLTNSGVYGYTLAQILAILPFVIVGKKYVFVEGGINDLVSSDASTNAAMQATMISIIETCFTTGVVPVLLNVGPWKNFTVEAPYSTWTTTRQTYTETYNSWLAGFAASNSLALLDIYTILKTPGDTTIAAAFDYGDHLHPNTSGYYAIANGLQSLIDANPIIFTGPPLPPSVSDVDTILLADDNTITMISSDTIMTRG